MIHFTNVDLYFSSLLLIVVGLKYNVEISKVGEQYFREDWFESSKYYTKCSYYLSLVGENPTILLINQLRETKKQ